MIKTGIILGLEEGRFPVWSKSEGLAKNLDVAQWLFEYCGWNSGQDSFPELCYVVEEGDWPEGDLYFPSDPRELYVLGQNCLYMN